MVMFSASFSARGPSKGPSAGRIRVMGGCAAARASIISLNAAISGSSRASAIIVTPWPVGGSGPASGARRKRRSARPLQPDGPRLMLRRTMVTGTPFRGSAVGTPFRGSAAWRAATLFRPSSVVLLADAAMPEARPMAANLGAGGFKGRAWAIGLEAPGLIPAADLAALPEPPDLALLCLPPAGIGPAMQA